MGFLITTTGTLGTVIFADLGARTFTHPIVNYDLETEYPIFELLLSADLQNAIDLGHVTVLDKIGGNTITDLEKFYMTKVVFDGNDDDIVDNSGQLDGFSGSYYLDAGNLTGSLPASIINSSTLVSSVNGATGAVSLDTDDVSEGSVNLYHTDTRSRNAIGVSASSGNYLNYDAGTGLFNMTALAITDVTVDSGVTISSTVYFGANYTGTEFQEGDTVVLAALTDGVETYMHNGGVAGTEADFVKIQSPDLSDTYIRSLFSATSPVTLSAGGDISIPVASTSVDGYISSTDWNTFNDKISGTGINNYVVRFDGTDSISTGIIRDDATSVGIGTAPVSTTQMGVLTTTHDNSIEIANTANSATDNYGIILNSTNSGVGTSYMGQFDDGRTTASGKFLTSIDANGTLEWATIPAGGVQSVNGATGAVTLDTDDISEGSTNLYYTDARVRLALSAGDGIIFATGTGVISADINDSATSSTTQLWSADKIYSELQTAGKLSWVWGAGTSRKSVTNSYLSQYGDAVTNQSPYIAYMAANLTNMSVATNGNETWVGEIRVNGSVVESVSITASDSGTKAIDVDIAAGDEVSFYCNGTSINRPSITVLVKEI